MKLKGSGTLQSKNKRNLKLNKTNQNKKYNRLDDMEGVVFSLSFLLRKKVRKISSPYT